jgi:hypothetical protein
MPKRLIVRIFSRFGREGSTVGTKKKDNYKMPKKIYWHLYSLQTLNTEKFVSVVNKILKQEFNVIK